MVTLFRVRSEPFRNISADEMFWPRWYTVLSMLCCAVAEQPLNSMFARVSIDVFTLRNPLSAFGEQTIATLDATSPLNVILFTSCISQTLLSSCFPASKVTIISFGTLTVQNSSMDSLQGLCNTLPLGTIHISFCAVVEGTALVNKSATILSLFF